MPETISPNALCSLADVKLWLSITDVVASRDDFLTLLINSATRLIEEHTGRRLKSRAYVDDKTSFNYNGTINGVIYLREFPVGSVEQVLIDGSAITDYTLDPAGYIRVIHEPTQAEIARTQGSDTIRVDYTAGYDPVPDDLRLACMELVAHMFNRSPHSKFARAGISSRAGGDLQESFVKDAIFPDSVKMALVKYERVEWVPHRVTV